MPLNKYDQSRLHNFYREALEQHGERDARSVRWTSQFGQEKRFQVLLGIGDLEGKTVLDVGCGLGDLYRYFLRRSMTVEYTGIDVVPEFIDAANKRFSDAEFITQDIFDVAENYDYVVASGALSFKVAENATYYQSMIKKMYEIATLGVAFNLLDKRSHIDDETYAAYDQNEIADFCSTFASNVEIVTDYLPRDFTIYLLKTQPKY